MTDVSCALSEMAKALGRAVPELAFVAEHGGTLV